MNRLRILLFIVSVLNIGLVLAQTERDSKAVEKGIDLSQVSKLIKKGAAIGNPIPSLDVEYCSADSSEAVVHANWDPSAVSISWYVFTLDEFSLPIPHPDWIEQIGTDETAVCYFNPYKIPSSYWGKDDTKRIYFQYQQYDSGGNPLLTQTDYTYVLKSPSIYDLSLQIDSICAGESTNLILDDSETGMEYFVYRNGFGPINFLSISGTDDTPINYSVNLAGTYTMVARNKETTVCVENMNGNPYLKVNALPIPTITGDNTVCLNETGVTYTTEASMTNYSWSVTGGTITSGANTNEITVTWTSVGNQAVSVNYENLSGCSANSSTVYSVTVSDLPTPTITGDNSVCLNETGVTYTTEASMTNYSWSVTGGTITAGATTNQITVTWTSLGNQTVSVNYDNANGCTAASSTDYSVTVNDLPIPTITGDNSVCLNETGVTYTTEASMTNYSWSVTGGTITAGATTNQITVTWTSVGNQTVSVNYDNA
ncbi:MAG: hypothetical protein JXB17_11150, partial [Bacteroidales bacterium]|nr:hypothetical protein [Bacteroidales bacterium]